MANITRTLILKDICKELNIGYNYQGKPVHLNRMSLSEVEDKRKQLKIYMKKLNSEIDKLLNTHYVLKYKENQVKEKERQKQIKLLSDEEYCISVIDGILYDEVIKRKRNFDMSKKALNHGGIYTSATMSIPRVGMGFKGYGGVCL